METANVPTDRMLKCSGSGVKIAAVGPPWEAPRLGWQPSDFIQWTSIELIHHLVWSYDNAVKPSALRGRRPQTVTGEACRPAALPDTERHRTGCEVPTADAVFTDERGRLPRSRSPVQLRVAVMAG